MGRPPHRTNRFRPTGPEHVPDRRLILLAPSRRREAQRPTILGDLAGSVADLGVFVPLACALILVNGLDAQAVLVSAGVLVIASGALFRIPFPVQPLKALTAVAVAQQLSPSVIHAAGLEIGVFLLLLSVGSIADRIARLFIKPVVRALQLGVGVLLVITAIRLAADPPAIFTGAPGFGWRIGLALAAFATVWWAARHDRYEVALLMLVVGCVATWLAATHGSFGPGRPTLYLRDVPQVTDFSAAFFLLVLPQIPLTFGNAVVGVTDVARETFGERAAGVTPKRVCISCGVGNIFSALVGGMPMCHGAGGLTAHVRLGARTARMNLVLGGVFVVLGLFFSSMVPEILGALPVWGLAALLIYAGLRHAALVLDLRGAELAIAAVAGAVGAWRSNLALTLVFALVGAHIARRARRN